MEEDLPLIRAKGSTSVPRATKILAVVVVIVCVLLPAAVITLVELRSPVEQTAVQSQRVKEALAAAKVASEAAAASVLEIFKDPRLGAFLRELPGGADIALIEPQSLMTRFWNEIGAAELVHSFGDTNPTTANCGFDVRVHMAQENDFIEFYNQWQLQALKYIPVDVANNVFVEWSEVNIFGFQPFRNASNPDLPTASDRPFYAAVNMYRGSAGNPQCGPVSAVLRRSYLQDQILGAAMDTGFFQGVCADNQTTGGFFGGDIAVCNAWPPGKRILGVPPYLNHLLWPYMSFFNATQALVGSQDYPYLNLARLLVRLLSRDTYTGEKDIDALRLLFLENTLGYMEMNPAYHIDLHRGIKMLIGTFGNIWGTELGNQVREWAISHEWTLAWAYNPEMSFRCGPAGGPKCQVPANFTQGFDRANRRILDPFVLQHINVNATATDGDRKDFVELWLSFNVTDMSKEAVGAAWATFEERFEGSKLSVEPLYYGACANDDCVGVTVLDRDCVCDR